MSLAHFSPPGVRSRPLDAAIVGDIGGTHARFARLGPDGEPSHIEVLRCANHPTLAAALREYVARSGGVQPEAVSIGIATPVSGDVIRMTNHAWSFSIEGLRDELELRRLVVSNDFTALALSLPELREDERTQVGGGHPRPRAAIGVLGAGTGLGVSGLIPVGDGYQPLAGEGGHATLAGQSAEELAVIAQLAHTYNHVSAERALSGPGLAALHRALAEVRGHPAPARTAEEITGHALADDDVLCRDSLTMFCALLGTHAANLALTLGALGGVYIGGGIVPRLGEFFARSPFRQRFEDKGRFSTYLAAIPTYVVTSPQAALVGARVALERALSATDSANDAEDKLSA